MIVLMRIPISATFIIIRGTSSLPRLPLLFCKATRPPQAIAHRRNNCFLDPMQQFLQTRTSRTIPPSSNAFATDRKASFALHTAPPSTTRASQHDHRSASGYRDAGPTFNF